MKFNFFFRPRLPAPITALLALAVAGAPVARGDELADVREQLRRLEQKLLVLERKQELKDEAAAAAAKAAPKLTLSDKGYTLASGDGANSIRIRGLAQLDSRHFLGDRGVGRDAFVLRRARLVSEGTLAKHYGFQLVTEFGGNATSVLDANLTVAVTPALQIKFGKFKTPIGLEQLQADAWGFFNERSIANNLAPNRDLGIQATGTLAGGKATYTLAVLNGVADGGNTTNTDFDNDQDYVGRLLLTPFKGSADSPLAGLSFGVAGSVGRQKTAAGRPAGFRTDGQQTFFSYNSAVIADGRNWRVSPQLDYRLGSFGLLGEYFLSTINVRPNATGAKAELKNHSWQLATGYVLTGEQSSYAGVVPATNFDLAAGTWGAFELAARVAQMDVDDDAYPTFASAASTANQATSLGLGLNWYLSKAVRFTFDYYQTDFDFHRTAPAVPTAAALGQDEKAFITRFQLTF